MRDDAGVPEVTVHRVALDVPAERVAALRATLAPEERARTFVATAAERTFVVTRAALRAVLRDLLGVEPTLAGRRPAVVGGPGWLDVNVAHSGAWALVAVGRGARVGVDLERRRPVDALGVARAFLAPGEAAALAALPDGVREAAFFRLWTRHEARVKAGVPRPRVRALPAPPGYAAALATDVAAEVTVRT